MSIQLPVKIHNKFEFRVTDAETGALKREEVAYNIVLNTMLNELSNVSVTNPSGSTYKYFTHIHYGTGTGTLDPARTSLFTFLGSKPTTRVYVKNEYPVAEAQFTIRLGAADHVGAIITEIGLASYSSGSGYLGTHALIKDSEGNPISITKTATDIIDIYATVYFDIADPAVTFGPNVKNTPITNPTSNSNWLSLLADDSYTAGSSTQFYRHMITKDNGYLNPIQQVIAKGPTYTGDSANRRISYATRLTETEANGIIRGVRFGTLIDMKFPVPGIWEGKSFTGLAVGTGDGTKTKFDLPWNEAVPDSVVVKVDGVQTTDLTVHPTRYEFIPGFIEKVMSSTTPAYQKESIQFTSRRPGGWIASVSNVIDTPPSTTPKLRIYKVSSNGTITLTDVKDLTGLTPIPISDRPYSVEFSKDFSAIVLSFSKGAKIAAVDFDKVTGKVGAGWQSTYTPITNATYAATDYFPRVSHLHDSSDFMVVSHSDTNWVLATGKDVKQTVYSISVDTVNKVLGATVNWVPLGASTNYGSPGTIKPNPSGTAIVAECYDRIYVCKINPVTGIFGTPTQSWTSRYTGDPYFMTDTGIFCVGGYDSSREHQTQTFIFDPVANTVTRPYSGTAVGTKGLARLNESTAYVVDHYGTSYKVTIDWSAATPTPVYENLNFGGYVTSGYYWSNQGLTYHPTEGVITVHSQGQDSGGTVFTHGLGSLKQIGTNTNNLIFNTPPAPGAVITCDERVEYMPKDSNHILDLTMVVQIGGVQS